MPVEVTESLAQFVVQAGFLLAVAPLIQGLIKKVKARLQNRQGPPLLQPYYDLHKLFRKETVMSAEASWVYRSAPWVGFLATLAAGFFIPVAFTGLPTAFAGDVLAVTFLFALARFFTALAALDTGSAFGGMGASREMAVSSLVEPAMLLSIFTVALGAGSTDLNRMAAFGAGRTAEELFTPAHFLALAGFFIVLIAETGRIPVDNPDTHLELTMIHEGMILEFSGRHLALAQWSHMVKQAALMALVANLFFPWGIATRWSLPGVVLGMAAFVAKAAVLGVILAAVESSFAKLRLFRVPDLLGASFVLSLLALVSGQVGR